VLSLILSRLLLFIRVLFILLLPVFLVFAFVVIIVKSCLCLARSADKTVLIKPLSLSNGQWLERSRGDVR
jgi:hypothetical protein